MRLKNLERYRVGGTADKPVLGIPLPKTPNDRVYRRSPNEAATPRHFVLGEVVDGVVATEAMTRRMKLSPRSGQTVCPYSGLVADDDDFTHPDDLGAAAELVKHLAFQDIRKAFGDMLDDVARGSSVLSVEHSTAQSPPTPRFARQDLMRELVCDHCGRDYGVYAIGLFCPDCGAPNVRLHFKRETELVDAQIRLAENVSDQQELAYRLLGNAHEDVLTAFESTLKAIYLHAMAQRPPGSPSFKPVGNDFQNIVRGRARFAEINIDPYAKLEPEALDELALNIQKRHVIGHNLGIADAKFAEHDEDANVGETIALVGEDIRIFAGISQAVVDDLDTWLGGGIPAPLVAEELKITPKTPQQRGHAALARLGLSPLAQRVGVWLSESSADGMRGQVHENDLLQAFSDVPANELEEAVAELSTDGYIATTRVMGPNALPRMRIAYALYAQFDPAVHGYDPTTDSAVLSKLALGTQSISVQQLHAESGWPLRRFNPALQIMASHIDPRRLIDRGGGEYSVGHFHLLAEDKVALRRWMQQVGVS